MAGLKGPRKSPLGRRAQLGVESLEGRLVPSTTAITDMTQWAQQFPGPTQAQKLWINFDGKHNDGQNISAFVAQPGQDRDTAIQDILYRVEEVFSPFNVQVLREKGDGNYSRNYGDTTVFVGGDYANQTTTRSNGLILLSKFAYSQTSFSYSDYASAIRGLDHVPNSDAYDLSFVDPMAYSPSGPFDKGANNATNWVNVEGDTGIAQGIAHEAGHTFGLAHVRTDKNYGTGPFVLDPTPLPTAATAATATAPAVPASANRGTIPDVMSYTDANLYFANATLPVTTFNNSGTGTAQDSREQPLSHLDFYVPQKIEIPINITTQNSFTYLQTVLVRAPRTATTTPPIRTRSIPAAPTSTPPRPSARAAALTAPSWGAAALTASWGATATSTPTSSPPPLWRSSTTSTWCPTTSCSRTRT